VASPTSPSTRRSRCLPPSRRRSRAAPSPSSRPSPRGEEQRQGEARWWQIWPLRASTTRRDVTSTWRSPPNVTWWRRIQPPRLGLLPTPGAARIRWCGADLVVVVGAECGPDTNQ
jgi:hypothetical protein